MTPTACIQKDVDFSADGLKLKGILHLPPGGRIPLVIGCHGLYSSAESPKQIALAEACNRRGIAYFRFDHRGCGRSEGQFDRVTSLEARCTDLAAALDAVSRRLDTGARLGLFGSSMGGTVCLKSAGRLAIGTVVTFGAPIRSDLSDGRPEKSRSEIVFDAAKRRFDISGNLSKLSHVLVFHGQADDVVPLDHAREIYDLAREPKKLVVQEHGDHPMSDPKHQREFVHRTSRWFDQWLNNP